MKLRLSPLISDIVITIYIIGTLYYRFKLEANLPIDPVSSIIIGIGFILIIWALIKLKFLNPNWFGLLNSKKSN